MNSIKLRGSKLERVELCPGSYKAEEQIADTPAGEAAESGKRIHSALDAVITLESVINAEPMQNAVEAHITANKGLYDEREQFVINWFAGIVQQTIQSRGGCNEIHKEHNGALEVKAGDSVFKMTGTPDLIVRCFDGVDVFEYKTGQGEQETADAHLQGQMYCLLAMKLVPPVMVKKPYNVRLHVIAAGNDKGAVHTFTDYDEKALKAVYQRLSNLATKASEDKALRVMSEKACKYCKASGTQFCPESCKAVERFAHNIEKMPDAVAMFGNLTPDQRAATLDRIRLIAPILEKIQGKAKELLLTQPDAITGYKMSAPSKVKKIDDPIKAFNVLNANLPQSRDELREQFVSICKVSLTDCKALYTESVRADQIKRGEKPVARSTLNDVAVKLLESTITESERSGALEKI